VFAVVILVTEIIPNISNPTQHSTVSSPKLVDSGSALPGGYDKTRSEILDELKKKEVVVTDKVSSQLSFHNGNQGAIGDWVVENPKSNKVIEQIDVILNGKRVATSVPIMPGQHIENITLLKTMNTGTYKVTAMINYYNANTKSYIGKTGYEIKMIVA
jgi:hypothetical protein